MLLSLGLLCLLTIIPIVPVRTIGTVGTIVACLDVQVELMMRREGISMLSTTTKSIEEIAATILTVIQLDEGGK